MDRVDNKSSTLAQLETYTLFGHFIVDKTGKSLEKLKDIHEYKCNALKNMVENQNEGCKCTTAQKHTGL